MKPATEEEGVRIYARETEWMSVWSLTFVDDLLAELVDDRPVPGCDGLRYEHHPISPRFIDSPRGVSNVVGLLRVALDEDLTDRRARIYLRRAIRALWAYRPGLKPPALKHPDQALREAAYWLSLAIGRAMALLADSPELAALLAALQHALAVLQAETEIRRHDVEPPPVAEPLDLTPIAPHAPCVPRARVGVSTPAP